MMLHKLAVQAFAAIKADLILSFIKVTNTNLYDLYELYSCTCNRFLAPIGNYAEFPKRNLDYLVYAVTQAEQRSAPFASHPDYRLKYLSALADTDRIHVITTVPLPPNRDPDEVLDLFDELLIKARWTLVNFTDLPQKTQDLLLHTLPDPEFVTESIAHSHKLATLSEDFPTGGTPALR
jgi:hypothetical protein